MVFATTIDVPARIDEQPIGHFQIHVLVLCFAVLVMDGYDALAIGNVGHVVAHLGKKSQTSSSTLLHGMMPSNPRFMTNGSQLTAA